MVSEFTSHPHSSPLMSSRRGTSKGEERALASKLFGNLGGQSLVAGEDADDGGLFGKTHGGVDSENQIADHEAPGEAPAGVWTDPDDEHTTVNVQKIARLRKLRTDENELNLTGDKYQQRVRKQHKKLHQRTEWATVDDDAKNKNKSKNQTALSHLLKEGGALVDEDGGLASSGRTLPQGTLEATRVRDANAAEPSNAVLRSVEFHSNGSLFLTAGLDKTIRLFDIDGTDNNKVQSVFFDDLPVHKAGFVNGGQQIIAAGRRKYFYVYDLEKASVERIAPLIGRAEKSLESFVYQQNNNTKSDPIVAFLGADGHVPLVSLKSKSCVASVKMNGTCRSACFTNDGAHLLTAGGDGTAYVWDLRSTRRPCVEKVTDDGAMCVTAIANSPTGTHCAFGSDSGVVNVYDSEKFKTFPGSNGDGNKTETNNSMQPTHPTRLTPTKALMNLTTSVDNLSFNGDGQMLAMSSRLKRDSLRLVHLPSCTVFSNWPSSKTPLHYVWCTAFSPTGGYLAVGNARGKALLYRIHAYGTGGGEEQ